MHSISILGQLLTFISKTVKSLGKRAFSNFIQNISYSYKWSVNYAEHMCAKMGVGIAIKYLLSDVSEN
jgi:hypothetical protein